jgi:hypothetical protein
MPGQKSANFEAMLASLTALVMVSNFSPSRSDHAPLHSCHSGVALNTARSLLELEVSTPMPQATFNSQLASVRPRRSVMLFFIAVWLHIGFK